MTLDLAALARLAANATPGPWLCDERAGIVAVYTGPPKGCLAGEVFVHAADGRWDTTAGRWEMDQHKVADAAYIAAASPDVVSALVRVALAAQTYVAITHGNLRGERYRTRQEARDALADALEELE